LSKLEVISKTSWKQPFKNRNKDVRLWGIPNKIKENCHIVDKSRRMVHFQFENKFNLSFTQDCAITSDCNVRLNIENQKLIKPIILNNPDSFFIASVVDVKINYHRLIDVENTTKNAITKLRIGQGKFRQQLIDFWDSQCAVSKVHINDLLVASHIKPWRSSTDLERLDVYNGLLLNPMLDALFDQGYISFDQDGNILISPLISDTIGQFNIQDANKLRKLNTKHLKYLQYHYNEVFINN